MNAEGAILMDIHDRIKQLESLVQSLAERCQGQSEALGRKAEKGADAGYSPPCCPGCGRMGEPTDTRIPALRVCENRECRVVSFMK